MEKTIDQVQQVGSSFFDAAQRVLEVVGNALKPGLDAALPIAREAGEQALKVASPAISEASKKAQEAIQSSGIDTEPVVGAAKVFPSHQTPAFVNVHYTLFLHSMSFTDLHTIYLKQSSN